METPLFSPLFGGITNTPPTLEPPQLYSSWSVSEDDANAALLLHDCARSRYSAIATWTQVDLAYSGNDPDKFGLVPSILDEPNKQEPVTDWDFLLRLFPPVLLPEFESHGNFSGLVPTKHLEKDNYSAPAGTQVTHQAYLQKGSSVDFLREESEGLFVLGSWLPPLIPYSHSSEEILKNTENKTFENTGVSQQDVFGFQNVLSNSKERLNGSIFSSHFPINGSTSAYKVPQKVDRTRGVLGQFVTEDPHKYLSPLSNCAVGKEENQMFQENHLLSKREASTTAAHGPQQFISSTPFFPGPTSNKENNIPEGIRSEFPPNYPHNSHDVIHTEMTPSDIGHKIHPQPQKRSFNQFHQQPGLCDKNSFYAKNTWADSKVLSPVFASWPTYGKENEVNSQISSRHLARASGSSVSQTSYSRMSPVFFSGTSGSPQISADTFGISGLLRGKENRRQHNLYNGKMPIKASFPKSSQDRPANEFAKCHNFHNKQSRLRACEKTEQNGRRCKNIQIPHPDCVQMQMGILSRSQKQHGGSSMDWINPSFLPLSPLTPGYKHTSNILPFIPHPFSSPANISFSSLPFRLSELVEHVHYENFPGLSPFFNDLFYGDTTAPYFPFPPPLNCYRPTKNRSGPANELHVHLEECSEQWRALERERKRAEAELGRHFPGKQVSGFHNTSLSGFPTKPSRVDRLIVDQFREQARVHTLVKKMEQLLGLPVHENIHAALQRHLEAICATQARRKEEMVNIAGPQRQGTSHYFKEKDVLALAAAVKDLTFFTRKTRTALWCALQVALSNTSASSPVRKEDVDRALSELCPLSGCAEKEDKRLNCQGVSRPSNEHV